jgi:hypothetical protein
MEERIKQILEILLAEKYKCKVSVNVKKATWLVARENLSANWFSRKLYHRKRWIQWKNLSKQSFR